MWSEETKELLEHINGVEWLLKRKNKTPAQVEEWESRLEILYEWLDEQEDWIAWKRRELWGDEEDDG